MNRECNIVKDIISLYVENMVSRDTRTFIEEHLEHCPECRSELEHIRKPVEFVTDMSAAPINDLKKKLFVRRVQTVLFTTALVLAIAVSVFAIMTAPRFFPYSHSLVQVTEGQNGVLTITFDNSVTGYGYTVRGDKERGTEIYCINAWDTVWDKHITDRGQQNIVITPTSNADIAVYYAQNNGSEDVLIYGLNMDDNAGTVTLPRLILIQYFGMAMLALTILIMARFLFRRREKVKIWLNWIIPFPIAYILAHICTKGISFYSYSAQRDFSIIVLVAILLYCVMLTGGNLYKAKKERKS
ncbi:MAG: hypothetical protein HFH88_01735 [Lachnospiraceae bacterium]|nr:hypothetical protein [Lachnospiraceae bacterium]